VERNALMQVEQVCQSDIEKICQPPKQVMQDPILQWMMAPPERMMAPPILHHGALDPFDPMNVGSLLEHMMDSALKMEDMMVQPMEPSFVLVFDMTYQEEPERSLEERTLDSMVSKLVHHSGCNKMKPAALPASENEAHDVTHHIRLKGQEILTQDSVPEDRLRLARRLTEVTPEEMMKIHEQHHGHHHHDEHEALFHIMCPKKQKCLMQALEQNMLEPQCAESLSRYEQVHQAEVARVEQTQLYTAMFQLYWALFLFLFVMVVMRKLKSDKGLFWMRLKVLQTVYSNPEIKAKVEDEMGVTIGDVPPVSYPALSKLSFRGRDVFHSKRKRFFRMLSFMLILLAMDAFGLLPSCWPLLMMGSCCLLLVLKMIVMCFSKPEVRECNCCCCGGSTLDVQNGTVSDSQACCSCCKGTGICTVKCHTCCRTSDDDMDGGGCCGGACGCGNGSDCNGDCGCCGGKSSNTASALKKPDVELAVELECCCCCCGDSGCKGNCECRGDESRALLKSNADLEGCCCCCCGGTALDAKNGTLSDAQACCCCCNGTGMCSKDCASCCGNGLNANNGFKLVVYQGVPIQMV